MYIGCRADFAGRERGARRTYTPRRLGVVLWNLSKLRHTRPTKLKRRMEMAETPRDRDACTRAVDGLCRVSVGTPRPSLPSRSRPACDIPISIDETVGVALLGTEEYFMNFLQSPSGFYRCPCPAHQLCAGEFAWLITVRRVPVSVDRLNERWRMRL